MSKKYELSSELSDAILKSKAYILIKNRSNLVEEVERLTAFIEGISLHQRIYLIKTNKLPSICKYEKKYLKWDKNLSKETFCGIPSKCRCAHDNHSLKISNAKQNMTNDDILVANEKRKRTVLNRYGVEHISQSNKFREKVEKTSIEKFGFKTSLMNPEIKNKIKTKNKQIYGFESPMSNTEISAKTLQTQREKYNGTFISRRDEFTGVMQERYGVDHALQNKKCREKQLSTNLARWGSTKPMDSFALKDQIRNTCLEKYGAPYYNQKNYDSALLKLISNKETFTSEFYRLGVKGILFTYPLLTRQTLRYNLIKYDVTYNKNLTTPEQIIYNFLLECGETNVLIRNRSIIKPLELDFYLPDKKLAIEVCGLYWHSEEQGKDKKYHLNKLEKCNELGIRLITIFEDEIKNLSLIQDKISHILGKNTKICGARQTIVKEITTKEAKTFLIDNHIQGYYQSKVKLGAFFNGKLLSVMTFGHLRNALGSKNKVHDEWEILRMASIGSIPGIASKMFSYFKKQYKPSKIISYCDRRWGTGKVYQEMGMKFSHNTAPGYWYSKNSVGPRLHRFTFRKSNLIKNGCDPKLTEKQFMLSMNYTKIWDCGNSVWLWTKIIS
jgi:very-short-patch-repair endonuclease